MDELFLHYVWQYQLFDKTHLKTTENLSVSVYSTGNSNDNAGPDFSQARLNLDQIQWIGEVEIHIKSSDWNIHEHSTNPAYDNVILHVVWEHDQEIRLSDNTVIPTLELKGKINPGLYQKYIDLSKSPKSIPCQDIIHRIPRIVLTNMLERTSVERLKIKAHQFLTSAKSLNNNLEETTYQTLAKTFGIKINQEPFLQLSKDLPLKILTKHIDQDLQVYSLLFGMAGFLENPQDNYQHSLSKEFNFLVKKYQLTQRLSRFHWKYSKLRPPSFPTVRLAQFGALLLSQPNFYRHILESSDLKLFQKSLNLVLPDYWSHHYDFGKPLKSGSNKPGAGFIRAITINTAIPILAATAIYMDNQIYMDKADSWMTGMKPESNKIIRMYADFDFHTDNAADSQGLIQLYNEYCVKKRCLACNIGVAILK